MSIVLTDTVGFIRELPPALIDAFRATLEEVTDADALLHLVDLSHPAWQSQIRSVMNILTDMPVTPGPALVAFNKIDAVDGETLALAREEFPQAVLFRRPKVSGWKLSAADSLSSFNTHSTLGKYLSIRFK